MLRKVARIHQLMADGYELTDIDSDHGCIEAHLRRGPQVLAVRLLPSEAEVLLFGSRRLR